MSRVIAVALALAALTANVSAVAAQNQPPAPASQPGTKPKPAPAPAPMPSPATEPTSMDLLPPNPQRPPAQLANVRVELTITDQRGTAAAAAKTVSMLLADRFNGRVRTSGNVKVGAGFQPITLNVDAQPEILRDGRIRVQVSLEYRAHNADSGPPEDAQPGGLVEQFSVILEDGKSMLITQSADPATDRKVRVEMKAALVK
jgi:hypothetical protein